MHYAYRPSNALRWDSKAYDCTSEILDNFATELSNEAER